MSWFWRSIIHQLIDKRSTSLYLYEVWNRMIPAHWKMSTTTDVFSLAWGALHPERPYTLKLVTRISKAFWSITENRKSPQCQSHRHNGNLPCHHDNYRFSFILLIQYANLSYNYKALVVWNMWPYYVFKVSSWFEQQGNVSVIIRFFFFRKIWIW